MKKIKIYLQYPWKFPDDAYYNNLIKFPPKDTIFTNANKKKFEMISPKKFEFMRKTKNFIRSLLKIIKYPNIVRAKKGDYNLVHCAHCLSLSKKPWIVDTEDYNRFAASGKISYSKFGKMLISKMLLRQQCKAIMPWTNAAKNNIIEALQNKEIEKKIQVVYPAVPVPKFKKIKQKKIILLFVGRWFLAKGGKTSLEVFDRITKKNKNVEAWFICPTPKEYKKKYQRNKQIKFMNLMPQDKLFKEIYPKADIFFYPGIGDTFGFAMPEAMSYGLPIITIDGMARKEIITDGKTGLIIPRPKGLTYENCLQEEMLSFLQKRTELLIKDKKLREKMGMAAKKEISHGKFSIKNRNKKLREIYKKAIAS